MFNKTKDFGPVNLMVDLETLSTNPEARVLSAGMVHFDKRGIIGTGRYLELSQSEQKDREVLNSTLDWWKTQPVPVPDKGTDSIYKLFVALDEMYVEGGTIWSQSSMDTEIIKNLAKDYRLNIAWPHWKVRDSRTFRNELSELGVDWGIVPPTKHHALTDAQVQADHVAYMQRQVEDKFKKKFWQFWK